MTATSIRTQSCIQAREQFYSMTSYIYINNTHLWLALKDVNNWYFHFKMFHVVEDRNFFKLKKKKQALPTTPPRNKQTDKQQNDVQPSRKCNLAFSQNKCKCGGKKGEGTPCYP